MKTLLYYSLLATILFALQLFEVSAAEPAVNRSFNKRSNTNLQFNQRTGILTLNLVSNVNSEMVFVSIVNTTGSTAMAGPYLYYDRLTIVGGSATFNLNLSSLIPGTYIINVNGQSINFEDQFDIQQPVVMKRIAR